MALAGFKYYWDLLELGSSRLVHYDFATSGSMPSSQGANPFYSGNLVQNGAANNFFAISGKGYFSGQYVDITHSTGLPNENWTHIFLYERDQKNGGILFSSFADSKLSGYSLGVTDNNRLYFETVGKNGEPFVVVSSQIYSDRNAVAVVKTNNILTFHNYNTDTRKVESDSYSLVQYNDNGNRARIGGSATEVYPFYGKIDEYLYIKNDLSPTNLNVLFSGFYSEFVSGASAIAATYQVPSGYSYTPSGITGVTGYTITQTYSGVDSFGLLVYIVTRTPETGYLLQMNIPTLQRGSQFYLVSGVSGFYVEDSSFLNNYGRYDAVAYKRTAIGRSDLFLVERDNYSARNLPSDYNLVKDNFEILPNTNPSHVQIYQNGLARFPVTDYSLVNFDLSLSGQSRNDVVVYDIISGSRESVYLTGVASGDTEPISSTNIANKIFFKNGILLRSSIDYVIRDSHFTWFASTPSSGSYLYAFEISPTTVAHSSSFNMKNLQYFDKKSSMLFLNGYRQILNKDYLEHSNLDLIEPTGLFETSLVGVYNNSQNFLET